MVDAQHIKSLKAEFETMQTKEDLLALLNLAKIAIWGEDARPFQLKAITYYANPKFATSRYREFTVKKKNGGERKINAPVQGLKNIQRCLNLILQCGFEPHQAATGFVPGKSIVDNALRHKGKHYVFNIDLKDFFPSIDFRRVKYCLTLPPFNLNDQQAEGRDFLGFLIANLCSAELDVERKNDNGDWIEIKKSVLPQGAPTSPTLTNIICQRLDRKLSGLAKCFGAEYSRYADDITFSSFHNVFQKDGKFLKELIKIIDNQKFTINESKTRLQRSSYRQEVTGLVVNTTVNVHRRYIKKIRTMINNWEKSGFEEANRLFLSEYINDKGHTKRGSVNMANVIEGKLDFLRMVKGNENETYKKLKDRFTILIQEKEMGYNIDKMIEVWEKDGIDKAIELYKPTSLT